jgi:hypothetical protein
MKTSRLKIGPTVTRPPVGPVPVSCLLTRCLRWYYDQTWLPPPPPHPLQHVGREVIAGNSWSSVTSQKIKERRSVRCQQSFSKHWTLTISVPCFRQGHHVRFQVLTTASMKMRKLSGTWRLTVS